MEVKKLPPLPKTFEKPLLKADSTTPALNVQDSVETNVPSPENPAQFKKWTILSYVAGDNNLQSYMVSTVDKMELAGSDANTHVVVQVDRGPHPSESIDPGWKNCRRYYITHDEVPDKINSQVLAQFDRTNMADPKVLKDFLVWGLKTFPSEYTALILNDHGDGFQGAMHDDSDAPAGQKNYITVPNLKWAIEEAEKETGKKINLVGFNACLMANVETAYQLKDTADFMVASEEVEFAPGWTIDNQYREENQKKMEEISGILGEAIKSFQETMKTKIDTTPEEFAKLIVQANAKHKEQISTFSAIDLKEMKSVADSIKELGDNIKKTDDKKAIRKSFGYAENYNQGWPPFHDVRDLQQACKNLVKYSPDENIKKSAQKVVDSTKKAIIANEVDGQSHAMSTGLNIYAPILKPDNYETDYKELALEKDTNWLEDFKAVQITQDEYQKEGDLYYGYGGLSKQA